MSTFLFHEIIYGPIKSRRLGSSLGINIIPINEKICSFDCIYCECGWTTAFNSDNFIDKNTFKYLLENSLKNLSSKGVHLDSITFSGNGESTLHPDFLNIIKETITLRDIYYPKTKITVLTNGTMIHLTEVADALSLIDQPILKLDSAIQTEFEAINQSLFKIDVFDLIDRYINLSIPNKIIQTILLRGERNGFKINNTKKESLDALASAINKINPKIWMLYAIDRETPEKKLEKITIIELEQIKNYLQNIVHCEIKIYG